LATVLIVDWRLVIGDCLLTRYWFD